MFDVAFERLPERKIRILVELTRQCPGAALQTNYLEQLVIINDKDVY